MIELNNLNGFSKARVWLKKAPNIKYKTISKLEEFFKIENPLECDKKKITIELSLFHKHIDNYGLLGVVYKPKKNNELKVIINVSKENDKIFKDSIGSMSDEIHVGLPEEYSLKILDELKNSINLNRFFTGVLEFNIGAHGYVGSSVAMFKRLTRIILNIILFGDDVFIKENLKTMIEKEIG